MADDFGNQLALMNPAAAAALRRQQYAQALLAAGSEITPLRSGWQAASRAVSGLLGGYEMGQGTQDLIALGRQQQADALDFYGQAQRGGAVGAPTAASVQAAPQITAAPRAPGPTSTMALAPPNLDPFYNAAAASTGIPKAVLAAKDFNESGFNNNLVSSTGAAGVPQILKSTAEAPGYGMDPLNPADRTDNSKAIPFGANYLAARGKSMFGDSWNPSDPGQLRTALIAYNGNTPTSGAYADKILAQSGLSAPAGGGAGGNVTMAGNLAGDGSGSAPSGTPSSGSTAPVGGAATAPVAGQPTGPAGFQRAQELFRQAAIADTSNNPRIRALAGSLRQQATMYMQMGAWSTPVTRKDGTIVQTNLMNGEVKIQGSPTRLTANAQGDLVGPDGSVVSPSTGWHMLKDLGDGNQQWIDPKGEPHILAMPIQRPDVEAARVVGRVNKALDSGQTPDPTDLSQYGTYLGVLGYGQKTDIDKNGRLITYTPKPPPSTIRTPDQINTDLGRITGKTPATTAPVPSPTGGPGGVSVTQVPGQTPAQIEAERETYKKNMDTASGYSSDLQKDADGTRLLIGDTNQIRAIVSQIPITGWGSEANLAAKNILQGLGASSDSIDTLTNISDPQIAQKMFMKLSFDALNSSLGKQREAASVVNNTMARMPGLETNPAATDVMTRTLDMHQRYLQDKADAFNSWLAAQHANATTEGHRLSEFQGSGAFARSDWQKDPNNDPRVYSAAAMLTANQPAKVWGIGLTAAQKDAAIRLANSQYPAEVIIHNDSQAQQ